MGLNVFNNKTVLVTGHTGFKGSWLSIWLLNLGAKVVGVSDSIPTDPSHFFVAGLSSHLDDYRFDICEREKLKKLIRDIRPDFIFHLAAQSLVKTSYSNPMETWLTNTMGTVSLLDALRNCDHECAVVFITSDKCYDNLEWVWGYRETDRLGGGDPYSASKAGAEMAIKSYVTSYFPKEGGIRVAIGRAGNVIGGGDWASNRIVPDCMRAWALGEKVILRNTRATRPWQHVLEPLSGYLNLAISLKNSPTYHGEPFNFGPPAHQNYSVHDLVLEMSRYWKGAEWTDLSASYDGPHESGLLKLNCDKALHYLQWQAIWNFQTTVMETVKWYENYYHHFNQSVLDFSISQINSYTKHAKDQGLQWVN